MLTLQELIEKHGIDIFEDTLVIAGDGVLLIEYGEEGPMLTLLKPDMVVVDEELSVEYLFN
ncbi:hypothetical protein [Bacillus sp. 7894-2]|uniref:hypothetical protein n=1 Tax=Bacillus sp. 7894-2 TaxID=2021695 RepID=UPI000BA73BB6|nr:hypothetical protein [Bacillus sp. 7894-2]PAE24037.1 hypothetical protein CHI10_14630 [Bacillus sp. 7894-2]